VIDENVDGADPMTFTDSVKEMFDQFGVGSEERSIYSFSPTLPENEQGEVVLPSDSPDGNDVQDALNGLFVAAIADSIADLQAVSASTVIELTGSELDLLAHTGTTVIELDLGDVKLLESVLHTWTSKLLLLIALNLDVDLDAYTPLPSYLEIQAAVIDANPDLLRLGSLATQALSDANQANRDFIAAYLAASSFIRNEIDDQTDDLFTIEPHRLAEEANVRTHLATLQGSLDVPTQILATGTTLFDEQAALASIDTKLGTNLANDGAFLYLGGFYDVAPFDPRYVLPTFDESNRIPDGSFPDPTFGRVLVPEPDATMAIIVGALALALLARHRNRKTANRLP
jgi:hypothetical protein